MTEDYTERDLIIHLQWFAQEQGRVPTKRIMDDEGPIDSSAYIDQFGSWDRAIEEAGFEPPPKDPSKSTLLEEIRRLADELGRTPTIEDNKKIGWFSQYQYEKKFGSWNEAILEAGLEPNRKYANVSDQELLNELVRVSNELNKPPSPDDIDEHGQYPSRIYKGRYGRWAQALNLANIPAEGHPRWEHNTWTSSKNELLQELVRLEDYMNDTPSKRDVRNHSKYCIENYESVFESWESALKAGGYEV